MCPTRQRCHQARPLHKKRAALFSTSDNYNPNNVHDNCLTSFIISSNTTLITQQMEQVRWVDGQMGWHERVHARLGENLYYFFIKLTPLDINRVQRELSKLIDRRAYGSVRAFAIFGAYDLIVRVWMNPTIVGKFRSELQGVLRDVLRTLHIFEVTSCEYRWYPSADPKVLAKVDESTIRGAQERSHNLAKLIAAGVVTYRDKPATPLIRFFTSVYLELPPTDNDIIDDLVDSLRPKIDYITVDQGYGFCSFLLKGESTDFFAIAQVPQLIAREFRSNRVTTETFLCWGPTLAGGEMIRNASFKAMEQKDLFVHSVIPEIYDQDDVTPIRKEEVLLFLKKLHEQVTNGLVLSDGDVALLHDGLYGYLTDNPTHSAKALFALFSDTERYLRNSYRELFGRKAIPLKVIGERAKVVLDSKKHVSLGDLLKLLYHLGEACGDTRLQWSQGQNFAELRNALMHGGLDTVSLADLEKVVQYLSGLRQLLETVGENNQEPYRGA